MFDHVEIKTVQFEQCRVFYERVLIALNIELKWSDDAAAGFGPVGDPKTRFLIEKADTRSVSHLAFIAQNKQAVHDFHAAGLAHGFTCNGPPGLRDQYAPNYYAAFLRDPDGNNIEAVVYL